jgi:SAM-dependent methyltransferase
VTSQQGTNSKVIEDDYRRASHQIWEAMAPGWKRWRAQLAEALTPVRRWLISDLAAQPADTVLELAAGTGDTGFEATENLGQGGTLISTDFSAGMVEVARRFGGEVRHGNIDYRVMDAERVELGARLNRRRALPKRLHADGGPGPGARRDAARTAPGWQLELSLAAAEVTARNWA